MQLQICTYMTRLIMVLPTKPQLHMPLEKDYQQSPIIYKNINYDLFLFLKRYMQFKIDTLDC